MKNMKNIKSFNIKLDSDIYSKEIIALSVSKFLDAAHFILQSVKPDKIMVKVSPDRAVFDRKKFTRDFYNELAHNLIRKKISEDNKSLREAIVFRALFSALGPEAEKSLKLTEKQNDYLDDPLDIAVPWEEKYGKKRKIKSEKRKRKA